MIRKYRSKMGRVAYYVYTTVAGSDRKHYVGKARTVDDAKQLERQAETESWQVKHGLREPDRPETFENLAKPWANARGEAGADGLPRRAAWVDDVSRMNRHILPFWGSYPILECGSVQLVREFIREREKEVGGATVGHILRLLSRFFNELPDDLRRRIGNPVAKLDKADRPRRSHDPKTTPFLENKADIRLLIDNLPHIVREVYALCVLTGARPAESQALWPADINLSRRTIHLQRAAKRKAKPGEPKVGPLKDHESRIVPINEDLLYIFRDYFMRRSEKQITSQFLFPALRARKGASGMIDGHTLEEVFNETRDALGLPKVTFYQASRHTFASHYVIDGGSIERLSKILGHSSVQVTERYTHLRSDHFTEHDFRPMLGLATDEVQAARARRGSSSPT